MLSVTLTEYNNRIFPKELPYWDLPFLLFFFSLVKSGISSTNWKGQPEFCQGFPHWDLLFIYLVSLVKVVSVPITMKEQPEFCKEFRHWALLFFFFLFFGQSGIRSTYWKGQPEFLQGIPPLSSPFFVVSLGNGIRFPLDKLGWSNKIGGEKVSLNISKKYWV